MTKKRSSHKSVPVPSEQSSVSIAGSVQQSVVISGNSNRASQTLLLGSSPQKAEIRSTLEEIARILTELDGKDKATIRSAMDDAIKETQRRSPRKRTIAEALSRALSIARSINSFVTAANALEAPLKSVVEWLGTRWHSLLDLIRT